MSKLETRALIRMWIEEENREQLFYFRALGSERGRHYTDKQKDYAINKAIVSTQFSDFCEIFVLWR